MKTWDKGEFGLSLDGPEDLQRKVRKERAGSRPPVMECLQSSFKVHRSQCGVHALERGDCAPAGPGSSLGAGRGGSKQPSTGPEGLAVSGASPTLDSYLEPLLRPAQRRQARGICRINCGVYSNALSGSFTMCNTVPMKEQTPWGSWPSFECLHLGE